LLIAVTVNDASRTTCYYQLTILLREESQIWSKWRFIGCR